MSSCPHGAGTNCEACRNLAHITALTYSPLTHQYMRELLAKLEPENIMLKARIVLLEAVAEAAERVDDTGYALDDLRAALRAAGYLKDHPNA